MSFYDIPKQNRTITAVISLVLLVAVGVVIAMSTAVSKVATQDQDPNFSVASQDASIADPKVSVSAEYAAIVTNLGDIIIKLYPADAAKTVKNFATLAKTGYYNGLIFHRVVKDFVIQGGDPQGDGSGGKSIYGDTFDDEINADSLGVAADVQALYQELYGYRYRSDITSHKLEVGSVAMANRGGNTNGSQFFIVTKNAQPQLDGKHTVFGQVIDGMSVVEQINNVEVGYNERPVTPVTMETVLIGDAEDQIRTKIADYHADRTATNE